jgi:3-methyladenine DNA glycosylase/8-oxoguanine DNA glycosylase
VGPLWEDRAACHSAFVAHDARLDGRVFIAEYGVSPVRFAQAAPLLLAKGRLTDAGLPIATIALTAGFGSVRRFNEAFSGRYRRAVRLEREGLSHSGWVEVCECPGEAALRVNVAVSLLPVLPQVLGRIRALFNLDCDPAADAEQVMRQLSQVPGVGTWTANCIAVRALAWPDAFPHSDFGIKLALKRGLGLDEYPAPGRILELAEAWRPWRSYAALNLWRSL